MMISRTGVGNSMNEAKFKGKDDIKEELGEEIWKIWIHRGSKNPRDWHVRLDDGKAIHEDDVWRVEVPSSGMTEQMDLSLIHISEPTRLRRISYAVFCL